MHTVKYCAGILPYKRGIIFAQAVTTNTRTDYIMAFFAQLLRALSAWVMRLLYGTAVKSAGKGALKKAPLELHKPNLLVTFIVICGINAANFFVMLFVSDRVAPVIISSGIVTAVTAFFALRGVRSRGAVRERIALCAGLTAFFGVFLFCVLVIDWWWLAWVAKLTLEVLLCYAIMLTRKTKADAAQSKAVNGIIKALRIPPDGKIAKAILREKGGGGREK